MGLSILAKNSTENAKLEFERLPDGRFFLKMTSANFESSIMYLSAADMLLFQKNVNGIENIVEPD